MEAKFEFKAQDMATMEKTMPGTSKIRRIAEKFEDDVLCLGQLKTLFGEPLYITKNLEDQYAYCILAVTESGKEIYLHVYCGPSGPAIGGARDEDSKAAADALAERIHSAKASDYEYEGFYFDGPSVVREGIRNGKPYIQEEEYDAAEFSRICEEAFGSGK